MLKITNTLETAFTQGNVPMPIGIEIYLFLDTFNIISGQTGVNFKTNVKIDAVMYPTNSIDQFSVVGNQIFTNDEISKEGKEGVGNREDALYNQHLMFRVFIENAVPITVGKFTIEGLNLRNV